MYRGHSVSEGSSQRTVVHARMWIVPHVEQVSTTRNCPNVQKCFRQGVERSYVRLCDILKWFPLFVYVFRSTEIRSARVNRMCPSSSSSLTKSLIM